MTPTVGTGAAAEPVRAPVWPLTAMVAMQALATMAAFSVPAAAPAVAADLGVDGALVGFYVSAVYGVGIASAVLSPGCIRRFGAVRVSQFVLLAVLAMLAAATAADSVALLAVSAVLLGVGYGATAPASTHLLVPRTPRRFMNMILSLRQIGVPMGGVLAGLVVPPLVLWGGWRVALLVQIVPALLLLLLLQWPRRGWDADRTPGLPLLRGTALAPLRLLRSHPPLRRLSFTCFIYAGIQLCFIAFMTVHLTGSAGMTLLFAGQALAAYQVAGVVSRPIWGWLADRLVSARSLLALQGALMAAAALLTGQFGPGWPYLAVLPVCVLAGATASGFTGIAYAEFARLGGERRTEATGLGSACMFAGVMVLPSLFGVLVAVRSDYTGAYAAIAVLALLGAGALASLPREAGRRGSGW